MATPKELYLGQPGTGDTTLYTVPAIGGVDAPASPFKVKVWTIILANTDTSAKTVRINKVPSGGSVNANNRIVPDISVPASSITLIEGVPLCVLSTGESLHALQQTATSITVTITGELT